MHRKLILVLIIAALVAAEGCRRGGDKKKPIEILREKDFQAIPSKDLDSIARPDGAKKKIVIDPLRPGLAGGAWKWEPDDLEPDNNVSIREAKQDIPGDKELVEIATKQLTAARKEFATKLRGDDLKEAADLLLNYRSNKPSPTLFSYDEIRKTARRAKKDKLYDKFTSRQIVVSYTAVLNEPGHILCYNATAEENKTHGVFVTDPNLIIGGVKPGGSIQFLKMEREDPLKNGNWQDGIDARVKKQDLRSLWWYYVKYAMPNFYRESELPGLRENLRQQKIGLPATPPESTPATFLEQLKLYKPDIVTEPGTGRNMLRFNKFLKENAPPHLLELVEASTLRINVEADLRRHEDLLACRSTAEAPTKEKEKFHYGIPTDTRFVQGNVVSFTWPTVELYDSKNIQFWISNLKQDSKDMMMKK